MASYPYRPGRCGTAEALVISSMFHYFLKVARKYGEAILAGKPVPTSGRILYGIGSTLVYEPLKNVLGLSRVRVAYTAGEAIGPDLFAFYRAIGLNLKQLYGQTEAFLYVTCQPDGEIFADTVGPPAPNVVVRIAESGEVQFKSPGMDIAAELIGIRPLYAKLSAFAVSSFIVGVSGALWAYVYLGSWEPLAFNIDRSFQLLFMVIIGGLGSILGAFLGAAFILILPIFLDQVPHVRNSASALPNKFGPHRCHLADD